MALRFLGIGAAKCATTWTYRVLSAHPCVRFPAGKEVNFWSHPHDRGFEWYTETMADDDPSLSMGEISVTYVSLPRAGIRLLRERYPDVRLFLHVRHPVDRAWSRAKMLIRDAKLDLDKVTDAELTSYVFGGNNIATGDYAAVLDRWLVAFPADQILTTRYEDLAARPEWAIERLCRHIGLDPGPLIDEQVLRRHEQRGQERSLPNGIRDMLVRVYEKPMERFRDQYGIDYTGNRTTDTTTDINP